MGLSTHLKACSACALKYFPPRILNPVSPKPFQGIDLFAGAGGLSLGARLAGVDVTHAVENQPAAAETYRLNQTQTHLIERDVRVLAEIPRTKGATLILFGGPPCQGFSTSNQKNRTASNPKNWLFKEFFRIAGTTKADWIVLENVKGVRETAGGMFESLIISEFEALGYSSQIWTLCASQYGVPQKRYRVFFIGRFKGTIPDKPDANPGRELTVQDAISDLPVLSVGASVDELGYRPGRASRYAQQMRGGLRTSTGHLVTANNRLVQERYRYIPAGGNWTDIPKRLMKNYSNLVDSRSRHSGIYRRLRWDQSSVVIANYRKNMLIHPDQDRGLSIREASRLQSFPDAYVFAGNIGERQQQVSNAVPPLLAKAVFTQIIKHS